MRLTVHYTDCHLVDVFLETAEERSLGRAELWQAVSAVLESQGVDPSRVIDVFTRVLDDNGEWRAAGRNADGKLVPLNLGPVPPPK